MTKRPIAIVLIAALYIATGSIGLASHLSEMSKSSFENDILWASLVSIAAIIAGVFILQAHNWARWLALAWIAFHVVLSIFHSPRELAIHAMLCAALGYFLFRPQATRYFRSTQTPPGS